MKNFSISKYILSLFLVTVIAANCIIVSPIYATVKANSDAQNNKQSSSWNRAESCADSIMERVKPLPVLGEWLAATYKHHREGKQYIGDAYFGAPVKFAEGVACEDANNRAFNNSENKLKLIVDASGIARRGTMQEKICLFGAVRERDHVYALFLNQAGEVAQVIEAKEKPQSDDYYAFACNTFLYKTKNSKAIRNCGGHRLVTKGPKGNKKAVNYKGNLVFLSAANTPTDKTGKAFDNAIDKPLNDGTLPTIDIKYHPVAAVLSVLTGTAISTLGTGVIIWKALLKRGYNKIFGKNKTQENEDNKKENENLSTETNAKNTEAENPEKEKLAQQPVQQSEPVIAQKTQQSNLSEPASDKEKVVRPHVA